VCLAIHCFIHLYIDISGDRLLLHICDIVYCWSFQRLYLKICSARLQVADIRFPLCEGVVRLLIHKAWTCTIVSNVFRKCRATCTLKTSSIYFDKEHAHCRPYNRLFFFILAQLFIYIFQLQSQVVAPMVGQSLLHFYIYIYVFLNLFLSWICCNTARWTLCNIQSIN
jgi:hypothetical protein